MLRLKLSHGERYVEFDFPEAYLVSQGHASRALHEMVVTLMPDVCAAVYHQYGYNPEWLANGYDGRTFKQREMLLKTLAKYRWNTLLDVGCGDGPDLFLIESTYPQAKCFGIDDNTRDVGRAHTKVKSPVAIHDANKFLYSVPTDAYDIVLTDACWMYLEPETLSEMKRIAKVAVVMAENLHDHPKHHETLLRHGHVETPISQEIRPAWEHGSIYEFTMV